MVSCKKYSLYQRAPILRTIVARVSKLPDDTRQILIKAIIFSKARRIFCKYDGTKKILYTSIIKYYKSFLFFL